MNEFHKEINEVKMEKIDNYNEGILIEGCQYTVSTNDSKEFNNIAFEGYKKQYGKAMMIFKTKQDKQITINPSYMSFAIEEETEMNPVVYRQSNEKE